MLLRIFILLSCVVLTSCSSLSLTQKKDQPISPIQSQPFQPQKIQWYSCQDEQFKTWFYDDIPQGLQCGQLNVPLDHQQPQGQQIRLALTKMPALSSQNQGAFVVISGGPGEHSLDFLANSFASTSINQALLTNFDVIGYAPRGVFPSSPSIFCGDNNHQEEDAQKFVQQCIQHTGVALLKHISTSDAVEDIEYLRKALGQSQLSFLAYSYGTQVLNEFSQRYPKAVRAAVFDGVVDPTEDYFTGVAGQERGFQQSFERFAKMCEQHHYCAWKKGEDPNRAFHDFLLKNAAKKLKDQQGKLITAEDILFRVQDHLYWEESWDKIIDLMADFSENRTDAYNEQVYDDNSPEQVNMQQNYQNSALVAINCADFAVKHLSEAEYIQRAKAVDDLSPFDNYPNRRTSDRQYLDACFYWISAGTAKLTPPQISDDLVQTLFIGQKYDPTTPLRNAIYMAKLFKAPLITRDGDGHTLALVGVSDCVDKIVIDYLLNPTHKIESRTCH